jgi:hypothetical protein
MCIIYELSNKHAQIKRKRILTSSECKATEFVQCSFANSEEKSTQFLVTVVSFYQLLRHCWQSGAPDFRVIVWLWDKQRFIAQTNYVVDTKTGV